MQSQFFNTNSVEQKRNNAVATLEKILARCIQQYNQAHVVKISEQDSVLDTLFNKRIAFIFDCSGDFSPLYESFEKQVKQRLQTYEAETSSLPKPSASKTGASASS